MTQQAITINNLTKKYDDKIAVDNLFYWGFSNIPNTYLFLVWTPTIKELKDIRENFENEPAIQSASPNVIYTGYIFKTWRDKIA